MSIVSTIDAINGLLSLKRAPIKSKTITIFDWDDTLFPSYAMTTNDHIKYIYNPSLLDNFFKPYFKFVSIKIKNIITNAQKYGDVVIITNAATGWIETCCNLLPDLLPFLKTIHIISARDEWIKVNGPITTDNLNKINDWKKLSYLKKVTNFIGNDTNMIMNLICIGDNINDHSSAKYTAKMINSNTSCIVYQKSIKFNEHPTIQCLIAQLENLYNYDIISKLLEVNESGTFIMSSTINGVTF